MQGQHCLDFNACFSFTVYLCVICACKVRLCLGCKQQTAGTWIAVAEVQQWLLSLQLQFMYCLSIPYPKLLCRHTVKYQWSPHFTAWQTDNNQRTWSSGCSSKAQLAKAYILQCAYLCVCQFLCCMQSKLCEFLMEAGASVTAVRQDRFQDTWEQKEQQMSNLCNYTRGRINSYQV